MSTAWVSDMAVVLLKQPLGNTVGQLGYAYDAKGYSGPLTAAGYPGESPQQQVRAGGRRRGAVGGGGGGRLGERAAGGAGRRAARSFGLGRGEASRA